MYVRYTDKGLLGCLFFDYTVKGGISCSFLYGFIQYCCTRTALHCYHYSQCIALCLIPALYYNTAYIIHVLYITLHTVYVYMQSYKYRYL